MSGGNIHKQQASWQHWSQTLGAMPLFGVTISVEGAFKYHLHLTRYVGISRIGVLPHYILFIFSIGGGASFALNKNPTYPTTFSRDLGIQTWLIIFYFVKVFNEMLYAYPYGYDAV